MNRRELPLEKGVIELTPKQNKVLAALLTSPSKAAAAQAAGISPRTLRDYLADPVFQAEYRRAFAGLVEDATRQVQQAISPALSTLREIVESGDENAQARILAARTILEYSMKLTEQTDILVRLEELEGQIGK